MDIFIPQAMAADGPGIGQGDPSMMIFLIIIVVVMYFMIWRPQQKQRKAQEALLTALSAGDEVITSGGIAGKIAKVEGSFILLTVSEGVAIKVQKTAVIQALPKGTIQHKAAE